MSVLSKLGLPLVLSTGLLTIVGSLLKAAIVKYNHYINSKSPTLLKLDIISLFHSVILSYYGIKYYFLIDNNHTNEILRNNEVNISNIVIFSMRYFITDLIGSYKGHILSLPIMFHHITGILIQYKMLFNLNNYPIIFSFAITEISSIFLNIMLILVNIEKNNLKLYNYIKYMFATSFFATRIVYSPLLIVNNSKMLIPYGNYKWLICAFPLLNCYWFKKIVCKALKK